ncbi:MAG: Ldh family oxidoreductase [Atribacterota bacterium]|nr:Ldh family oxidoreductase [Atribacterota bacterium]
MTDNKEMAIKVSGSNLYDFCLACFLKIGLSEEHAGILSDTLVQANLRGVDSHGVLRLPVYIERSRIGLISYQKDINIISKNLCVSLIDGENNFGQIVAYYGMKEAIKKADQKETGIGFVGISHTNHMGMAAYYAMMAAKKGMVGIAMSNSPATVAPWGGAQPMLGTNPIAIAIPAGKEYPVVLDMATSLVARGKIRLALDNKQEIPLGWALDLDGNPTTDPQKAIKGALLPFGGPKGYAISLIIQIFSTILSNSAREMEIKSMYDFSGKSEIGIFLGAIKIDCFISRDKFNHEMDELIERIKTSKLAKGNEMIYLPGEIELEQQKKREKEGIPLSKTLYDNLRILADELNVQFNI